MTKKQLIEYLTNSNFPDETPVTIWVDEIDEALPIEEIGENTENGSMIIYAKV